MNIENHFTQLPQFNYPSDRQLSEKVENPLENLSALNDSLDKCLANFQKDLGDFQFYVILPKANQENLILPGSETIAEELEIEPIDIRQNLEKVAKAVHQCDFMALKSEEGAKTQAKFPQKWAHLLAQQKIKQLKVKSEDTQVLDFRDIEISYFTEAEVKSFSFTVLKAIHLADQIKILEQQWQKMEKRKREREEAIDRERRLQEERINNRLKPVISAVDDWEEHALHFEKIKEEMDGEALIMAFISQNQEEKKEELFLEKALEHKQRIIKQDRISFELRQSNFLFEDTYCSIKDLENSDLDQNLLAGSSLIAPNISHNLG